MGCRTNEIEDEFDDDVFIVERFCFYCSVYGIQCVCVCVWRLQRLSDCFSVFNDTFERIVDDRVYYLL